VAVVGAGGFGLHHLAMVQRLAARGEARLVAVADPVLPTAGALGPETPVFSSLPELLAAVEVDVVTVATPIHTHLGLARSALLAGADVLLEKPPAASAAEFSELVDLTRTTGRSCQVGFQSLGSAALPVLDELIGSGVLGEVRGVGGYGAWVRSRDYWTRSAWTGRRRLGEHPVMDGVVTNAFAHAVVTALRLAGRRRWVDVASVGTELFRANPIEADDTSVVTIQTSGGLPVVLGLTLCAARSTDPTVTVYGSRGEVTLSYTTDAVTVRRPGAAPVTTRYARTDLLANLLAHRRDPSVELLAPLESTGAFTRVLEALRLAGDPTPLGEEHVTWVADAEGEHPVVRDVEHWLRRASSELTSLAEIGAPWPLPHPPVGLRPAPEPSPLLELQVGTRLVGRYVDGSEVLPSSCPRPYLHPLRTLAGVGVTATHPADHDWHLGVGVAIPDVSCGEAAGHNFWGGRTYVRGGGYRWRHDHGSIQHRSWLSRTDSQVVEELDWVGVDGSTVLRERRRLAWRAFGEVGWVLEVGFRLTPLGPEPVRLGSPGSKGRLGGGYGGFFWRLPECRELAVRTPTAQGEELVHGSTGRWLALTATLEQGPVTLLAAGADQQSAADPWFVRAAEYPGFGSSLAWSAGVTTSQARPLRRSVAVLVADGRLTPEQLDTCATELSRRSHES
jgi:predicted dehydrogenase